MSGVLVTGASGFIGLPLLEQLAGAGEEVHAISTRARPPKVAGVCWHRVDLADGAAPAELVGQVAPERLVHLAWCTEHGRFWRSSENVLWVGRSLQLLRAFSRRGGRRAVVLGTCAEYDWSNVEGPLSERTSPLAPATPYGTAKDALRRLAVKHAEQEGMELAWGRLFFLYGPREAPGRLVPSAIRAVLAGEPIVTGSGERARDFMYVEDVASALAALLDSAVVGAVNIASGVRVTVGEVVEQIARSSGRPELARSGGLPDRPGEPPLLLADVTRLRDEVGFRPRWALADGLGASVRWWREHADRHDLPRDGEIIPPAAPRTAAPRCSRPPAWPAPRR
jgi:nucleoside-diphosphate-sugar epimerase